MTTLEAERMEKKQEVSMMRDLVNAQQRLLDSGRNEVLTHCELLEGLHAQIESMQEEINAREHVCRTKRREIEKHRANRPKIIQERIVSELMTRFDNGLDSTTSENRLLFDPAFRKSQQVSGTVNITDTVTPAKMRLRLLVKRETSFKELLDQCLGMLGLSQGDADDARYIICDAGGTMFPHAAPVLQELQHSGGTPDLFLNLRHRIKEKELQSFFPTGTALDRPPPGPGGSETLLNRIQKFDDVLNTPRLLFRDLGIFLMFTVVFVYVLFYRRDVKTVFTINHYVSQQLTGQPFGAYRQLTVQDIATPEHVWEWLRGPLMAFLYTTRFFSDQSFRTPGVLGQSLRLLGPVRLLQNRVLPSSCTLRDNVEGVNLLFSECYGPYSTSDRDESYFGPRVNDTKEDIGFNFVYSDTGSIHGSLDTYDLSGYLLDLDANQTASNITLDYLRDNNWIGRQTRVVAVMMNLLEPNSGYTTVVKMLFEFHPAGAIYPNLKRSGLVVDSYATKDQRTRGIFEAVLALGMVYFIQLNIRYLLAARQGRHSFTRLSWLTSSLKIYLSNLWMTVDLIVFLCFFSSCMIRIGFHTNPTRREFKYSTTQYVELSGLAFWYNSMFHVEALGFLMFIIKGLKYLKLSRHMNIVVTAIQLAQRQLLGIAIVFFAFLFGFAIAANNIYGPELFEFNDPLTSAKSLILLLRGSVNYDALVEANEIFTPLFVLAFSILMTFTVSNVFLAIVANHFLDVKHLLGPRQRKLDFWECVDWIFPGTLLYFEMRRLQKADSSG